MLDKERMEIEEPGLATDSHLPLPQFLFPTNKGPLDRILSFGRLGKICQEISAMGGESDFLENALEAFHINFDIPEKDLSRIPEKGPVVVVANHPFGAIEGILLYRLLRMIRSDVKIMANHILQLVPELRDVLIMVDPYGTRGAISSNVNPIRKTIGWLRSGGVVGVFPAGEVAHIQLRKFEVSDPPWNPRLAPIIRRTQAAVLPVYFSGRNGFLFQLLGLIHPKLRTAMLARELLNKTNKNITVRIGRAIPFEKLNRIQSDGHLIGYLRTRTYMLGCRRAKYPRPFLAGPVDRFVRTWPKVADAQRSSLLKQEVEALPSDHLLADSPGLSVYKAAASQIPHLLHEIGRLREITFRQANEGSGKAIDLDRFDTYYTHLFLWDKEKSEVAGAYRLGMTDGIATQVGISGLYTHDLFEYDWRLLDRIGPALELGRSFVRLEYQKNYRPLMLLWKGIGRFVAANPRYKILFGPVSISGDYRAASHQLIVSFLKTNNLETDLSRLVKPRHPISEKATDKSLVQGALPLIHDVRDLSEIVSDIEDDGKGIPILLRHYLKLGGKTLAYSFDPGFNGVLDALIMVDLTQTDPKILETYLEKSGATTFLRYHYNDPRTRCA
ncbi:MAG: lysophospholipid acyltransferase family protein [Deltaproteobacteria bacterium]|nr:lysophospholipid acyltransferase family protein [Deltaproteobacteria bacterium]